MTKNQHDYYLQQMGIQRWISRNTAVNTEQVMANDIINTQSEKPVSELSWEELAARVAACTLCPLLSQSRTHHVFGDGNHNADLVIVGEAPGANEDLQGKPFVGRAGQLLTEMLKAIGLKREDIYITNILKSRPPNNRDPKPEETANCTPYLDRQLTLLKPKLMVAVGRIAAQYLLGTNETMAKLRGQQFTFRDTGTPLLVTYHPAYLLRSPGQKKEAYKDFLLIKKALETL
ncbi:MAG: phage polymerase-related protein [Gammaproteobacteria bacterium]|jgi:DNA polymerase|nr:phage polymerase-related protein [Gammaproteobacteria bacterium]